MLSTGNEDTLCKLFSDFWYYEEINYYVHIRKELVKLKCWISSYGILKMLFLYYKELCCTVKLAKKWIPIRYRYFQTRYPLESINYSLLSLLLENWELTIIACTTKMQPNSKSNYLLHESLEDFDMCCHLRIKLTLNEVSNF